ncbi:MAG: single-stranded-DNA-specific exonuclease RecJ, partial [Anaerolineaceae bacterium]|nr:single-stranded-DNA-specific exonuclease RecJ [Anaerolineaceae bacterium]
MNRNGNTIWKIAEPISEDVNEQLNSLPRGLRQLLFNRGIQTINEAEIFLSVEGSIHDPYLIKDMDKAVKRIAEAIEKDELIAVYGDYDVDGVTATALLCRVLESANAKAIPHIPNRFESGYGLNSESLDFLFDQGVKLVITVDCGIRALKEVAHAGHLGLDIIVSDHHEPGNELPEAYAILDHKRDGDSYPDKNLAGVGIAYKLSEALAEHLFPSIDIRETIKENLDLVAVGTVADIVPLKGENRSLVKAGLKRLRKGSNPGLSSLAGAAMVKLDTLHARDIGFIIGPRLNAAGRLGSARTALDLLLSKNKSDTGLLAQLLDDQNRQRQNVTKDIQQRSKDIANYDEKDNLVFAVSQDFHKGVVGLAASRLTEEFYRPAVVGDQNEEFTVASCRSINEFSIIDALDECEDLLVKHGGHKMAAGFTVRNEHVEILRKRLMQIADRELGDKDLKKEYRVDMEIPLRKIPRNILSGLEKLEPTGEKNPSVLFVSRNTQVLSAKKIGKDKSHLKLKLADGKVVYDAIAFRQADWANDTPEEIDILFSIEENTFMGKTTMQLNVKD